MNRLTQAAKAIEMREQGHTMRAIAAAIGVSREMVSTFVADVPKPDRRLTPDDRNPLTPKPCRCEEPVIVADFEDLRCFTCGRAAK